MVPCNKTKTIANIKLRIKKSRFLLEQVPISLDFSVITENEETA